MFGPLGFPELVFILTVAFLLLGPRQMSLLSGKLGGILRDLYKATADVRRQINAERAALEEEIKRGQQPLREAADEIKGIDRRLRDEERKIRKEVGSAWSRRHVLGQDDEPPADDAEQKTNGDAAAEGAAADGTAAEATAAETKADTTADATPEIRTPEGIAPRGSLDPGPSETSTAETSTAEASKAQTSPAETGTAETKTAATGDAEATDNKTADTGDTKAEPAGPSAESPDDERDTP